jgi:uncharacterized protein
MTRTFIITKLRRLRPVLARRYGVRSLRLFGSYARGTQHARSDIDLLVEFREPIDLFRYIEFENYLSDEIGARVDAVMPDALKPRLRDHVINEALPV